MILIKSSNKELKKKIIKLNNVSPGIVYGIIKLKQWLYLYSIQSLGFNPITDLINYYYKIPRTYFTFAGYYLLTYLFIYIDVWPESSSIDITFIAKYHAFQGMSEGLDETLFYTNRERSLSH